MALPRVYNPYTTYPVSDWRWDNFTPAEVKCRDGSLMINKQAMDTLQKLRTRWGRPIKINSAYRSPDYNKSVGGATSSYHLQAKAFDISTIGWSLEDWKNFEALARQCGFKGFGFYSNFIHIDIGPAREWGTRPAEPATASPATGEAQKPAKSAGVLATLFKLIADMFKGKS